ncbi:MAG: PEGA domain-containing protein [Deltaproteobacteria bacterium]|nr:PEGA domain-containing protein [Deltaproteobacteria bacterium]
MDTSLHVEDSPRLAAGSFKGPSGRPSNMASLALCLALSLAVFILAGCSGPLSVRYSPGLAPPHPAPKAPLKIFVEQFIDARGEKDPRAIGKVTAVVSDMSGESLTLTEDVSSLVTRAFAQELSSAGFTVSTGDEAGRAGTDLVLRGAVKGFRLDIGPRDEIMIELSAEFKEPLSGKAVWSGTEIHKDSRYAGVLGNTRATISAYISASLSKVIKRTIADASQTLPVKAGASAPLSAALPAAPAAPAALSNAHAPGRVSVASEPPRAKVYIGGVYYGLTPITIDLEPGVYELTLRLKGRRENKEKISIRPGQLTEVEEALDKE